MLSTQLGPQHRGRALACEHFYDSTILGSISVKFGSIAVANLALVQHSGTFEPFNIVKNHRGVDAPGTDIVHALSNVSKPQLLT